MINLKNIAAFAEATHPKIAYFSMEIGTDPRIPVYSGGLGILAGDMLKAAADIKLPIIGITLLYKEGFFDQHLDWEGNQTETPTRWNPADFMQVLPNRVEVKIEGRTVKLQAWKHEITGQSGGKVAIYCLDSDLQENTEQDRDLTKRLYGGDSRYRLAQEIILGIGGVRLIDDLGFDKIEKYHMNEGHASLLTLELLRIAEGDEQEVKDVCVFTTHTPVAAGHDRFSYDLVQQVIDTSQFPINTIKKYAGQDELNTTRLAISLSHFINGVSRKHAVVSRNMFPGTKINAITNGVHSITWTCPEIAELYDKHIEDWREDPSGLRNALVIKNKEMWEAHQKAKQRLMNIVKEKSGIDMDVNTFTIGFARRATGYKRATLLFQDIERLKEVARNAGQVQVIFAGKSHPKDGEGKDIIRRIFKTKELLKDGIKVVYLENYEMGLAKTLVSGVDVWLNNPSRPREASGTSGMKAAHNGVPNFSVLDGWWIEGHIEGITGWSIGPKPMEVSLDQASNDYEDAKDMYNKLEYLILPKYYNAREEWIQVMKNAIAFNGSFFTSARMLLQYISNAYVA